MRRSFALTPMAVAAFCLISAARGQDAASAPAADGKIALRVLYAGHPGSDREKDFLTFLGEHFATVGQGDLAQFADEQASGYDVVIMDYDGEGFKAPRPRISKQYARPTVTIAVVGGLAGQGLRLKTGYE